MIGKYIDFFNTICVINICFAFAFSLPCFALPEVLSKPEQKIIDVEYAPPILKPKSEVIKFAKKHNVKLLADELNIEFKKNNKYMYKSYKYVYPCYDDKDIYVILYKNRWNIRFATPQELKEIYGDLR